MPSGCLQLLYNYARPWQLPNYFLSISLFFSLTRIFHQLLASRGLLNTLLDGYEPAFLHDPRVHIHLTSLEVIVPPPLPLKNYLVNGQAINQEIDNTMTQCDSFIKEILSSHYIRDLTHIEAFLL
jgi:hypothetical protein